VTSVNTYFQDGILRQGSVFDQVFARE